MITSEWWSYYRGVTDTNNIIICPLINYFQKDSFSFKTFPIFCLNNPTEKPQ